MIIMSTLFYIVWQGEKPWYGCQNHLDKTIVQCLFPGVTLLPGEPFDILMFL